MLETRFPRIPATWAARPGRSCPVKVVPGATRPCRAPQIGGARQRLLDAAAELVQLGADGITTTCGFLSLYQRGSPAMSASVDLEPDADPVYRRILPPGKRVGVITISAASLTDEHLIAAGADPNTPVVGTDNGREFSRAIINDADRLDAPPPSGTSSTQATHSSRRIPISVFCSNAPTWCRTHAPSPSICACRCSASQPDLVPRRTGAARFRSTPSGPRECASMSAARRYCRSIVIRGATEADVGLLRKWSAIGDVRRGQRCRAPRVGPVAPRVRPERAFEALIATANGKPAGIAVFQPSRPGSAGTLLEDIFVSEWARGLGVGKRLMARLAGYYGRTWMGPARFSVLGWNPARGFTSTSAPLNQWCATAEGEALHRLADEDRSSG